MKIAITGKGGVGKTTLAAILARIYAEEGRPVIAIDADPAGGLASALGLPPDKVDELEPIAEMDDLIYERTGAKRGSYGGFFSLTPRVDDIPDRFSLLHQGVRLLKLGTIEAGGSGCMCPESALLKALVTHLLLYRDEVMIMDMEAGVEHLGRATAQAVDGMLVVVEPGRRSIEVARRIRELAGDLHLERLYAVGNKVRSETDRAFIAQASPLPVAGYLSASPAVIEADLKGISVYDAAPQMVEEARARVETRGMRGGWGVRRAGIVLLAFLLTILAAGRVAADPGPLPSAAYVVGVVGHRQLRPLSCESRSAVDLAAFWGVGVEEGAFFDTLPKSDNPHRGFVGDVDDRPGSLPPGGYGVYAEPVAGALRRYGLDARAHTWFGLDRLREELAAGRPVVIWATYRMLRPEVASWIAGDGSVSIIVQWEHTFIAVGYDEEGVYLIDAYDALTHYYPNEVFVAAWMQLNEMAVTVDGYLPPPPYPWGEAGERGWWVGDTALRGPH